MPPTAPLAAKHGKRARGGYRAAARNVTLAERRVTQGRLPLMPPPARPVWTGQIRLALVALPVKLYSALDSREKISFNQIHEPTKQRIRYEKVAPGVGPVDKDDIVKGYEFSKGRYVLFSERNSSADRFQNARHDPVRPAETIDPVYFDKPYFPCLMANGRRALSRGMRALKKTKTIGLGQITMRGRSHRGGEAPEDGLMVETLHYAGSCARQGVLDGFQWQARRRSDRPRRGIDRPQES